MASILSAGEWGELADAVLRAAGKAKCCETRTVLETTIDAAGACVHARKDPVTLQERLDGLISALTDALLHLART